MLLSAHNITTGYGDKVVVREATLQVDAGEVVALIGANGAGKSTLLNGLFGVTPLMGGEVLWEGEDISRRSPAAKLQLGMAYAPQGAEVYRTLTVAENLEMGGFAVRDRHRVAENIRKVYELFPVLYDRRRRRAGLLSGGERQMLATGALLVSSPRLALIDEPSGGLAPLIVEKMFATLRAIVDSFSMSLLLVEQNLDAALAIADRAYVMSAGRIVRSGTVAALQNDPLLAESFFGEDPANGEDDSDATEQGDSAIPRAAAFGKR